MREWIKRHRWDGIVTVEDITDAVQFWIVCVALGISFGSVVALLWFGQ